MPHALGAQDLVALHRDAVAAQVPHGEARQDARVSDQGAEAEGEEEDLPAAGLPAGVLDHARHVLDGVHLPDGVLELGRVGGGAVQHVLRVERLTLE